jgi:hypothetical protein
MRNGEWIDADKFWLYLKRYYLPGEKGNPPVAAELNGRPLTSKSKIGDLVHRLKSGAHKEIRAVYAEEVLSYADLPFDIVEELLAEKRQEIQILKRPNGKYCLAVMQGDVIIGYRRGKDMDTREQAERRKKNIEKTYG